MLAERLPYRGFILTVVPHPPFWQVTIDPGESGPAALNLPMCQNEDRAAAVELAKATVDQHLEGPAILR